MPRRRIYPSNADRQRAFRERQKARNRPKVAIINGEKVPLVLLPDHAWAFYIYMALRRQQVPAAEAERRAQEPFQLV